MIPTGGLYTIVHIIWIFSYKAFGIIRQNILSFLIIFSVMLSATYGLYKTVGGALSSDNSNLETIKRLTYQCIPPTQEYREKKIIVRVDDIQAFWLRDIQLKIMDELMARDIPAMVSVIPIDINADELLVDYLKRNACKLEFAMHGWDQGKDSNYTIPEFGDLSEAEALERISQGKPILEEIAKTSITTFVPPNNEYSEGTKYALVKSGFKVISSEGKGVFDWTAETYDFLNEHLVTPDKAVADCKAGLEEKGLCILMVHPQDFATRGRLDEAKYDNLIKILDELEQLDVMFVTPKDVEYASELIPEVVKQTVFNKEADD